MRYYFIENHCYGMRIFLRKFGTPGKKPVREEEKWDNCGIMGPSDASPTSQTDMSKLSLLPPAPFPSPSIHKHIPKGTGFLSSVITLLVTERTRNLRVSFDFSVSLTQCINKLFRLQTSVFPVFCFFTATLLKTPQILSFLPLLFFGHGRVYIK